MARERVIAALTIGATAVMMLIVRRYADGRWEYINELTASTSLAEALDSENIIDLSAINRTLPAIRAMYEIAAEEGVDRVISTATSALNQATNRVDLIRTFREVLDLSYIEILSPREEAELSFIGAVSDFDPEKHYLLIDLGGSSTEIVYGTPEHIDNAISIPFGYLNLTHRFHLDHFLLFLHRHAAEKALLGEILPYKRVVGDWIRKHNPTVIISGSIATSIVGMRNKEQVMDRKQVQGEESDIQEVWTLYRKLARTFPHDRINIPGVERDRVRMLPGAMLLLTTILRGFGLSNFKISTSGVRMGLVRRFEQMEETEMAVASLNQGEFF